MNVVIADEVHFYWWINVTDSDDDDQ